MSHKTKSFFLSPFDQRLLTLWTVEILLSPLKLIIDAAVKRVKQRIPILTMPDNCIFIGSLASFCSRDMGNI